MPGPLEGVTVVDFSTALAGPMAAGLLADMGADLDARGVFRRDRHPVAGSIVQPRLPMAFSGTEAEPGVFAPEHGRDTDALLEELGRDPGALRDAGVVE